MVTSADAFSELDAEVEAWLLAERLKDAEDWEAGTEPAPGDEYLWGPLNPTPAVARFVGAEVCREELLFEWERAAEQVARWQGVQSRILAEALDLALLDGASRSDTTLSVRSLAAELACTVGMSDRTLEQHMNDAQVMRDRFARAFAALRDGRLSRAHAQVIVDEGIRLADEAVRAEYEELVLQIVPHLTTGRLRVAAAAIAEQLHPSSLADRHADARSRRRVTVRDAGDGMAELYVLLPAVLAWAIHDRLTKFGRSVRRAEHAAVKAAAKKGAAIDELAANDERAPVDERTMDQLRADVLCDVLLTGHATTAGIDRDGGAGIDAVRGIVQITLPVGAIVGDQGVQAPFLSGKGPIDPDSARRIAATATVWNRIFTDPHTGNVVATDRRFPTKAQRRHLRARDEHCRFPGCRQPVWRSDVDHTVAHQDGGATAICNLAHLCRRHHMTKHQTAWQVRQLEGGVLEWTSPLGRIYIDMPPPTLRFIPDRG